ncbi:MAG TPA: ABC transporter permease [Bryobacteraceae bacterium]|jgi:putative ABC transport system permease protein|nr:ABC transporter permease [Bryobacteraceae bacterium]
MRILVKSPGFALATVLVLALGIGANTAIFSVVYSVLLKPLPYRDPARLVVALHEGRYPVSPADFLDYRAQVHAFDQLAAAQAWGGSLAGADKAEEIPGLQVTANLFTTLGVAPLLGRTFARGEDQPGTPRVLVIGYALWQRQFAGSPAVIGKTIQLTDRDYTIVGVMPPQFQFAPFWQTQAEMWTPLVLGDRVTDRAGSSLRLFARLSAGTSVAQAQAQMDTVARRLAAAYPKTNTNLGIQVVSLHEKVVGAVRPTVLLLLATVVFVLVIACADITNLFLTRAVSRQKEIAVRLAIGASRMRIVRQLAGESLGLALLGGAGGLLLARLSLALLNAMLPAAGMPRQHEVTLDAAVFVFTLLASVAVGLVSGLVPALQASRLDLNESLKEGGRNATAGGAGRRTRTALVVAQVSLALVLLVCAGLMIRTLRNLNLVDAGFNPRQLLALQVHAPAAAYDTAQKRVALFQQVQDKLAALPGVQSVSAINHLPVGGDIWAFGYDVVGRPAPPPGQGFGAIYRVIRPGYFETMQIQLLRGRAFTPRDDDRSPAVVIVNEAMARQQWPGENPVGREILLREPNQEPVRMTIVGVVKNVIQSDWTGAPDHELYLPYLQRPNGFGLTALTFVVRTTADPEALAKSCESAVRAVDRSIPLSRVESMQRVIADKLWRSRVSAMLLGAFAAIALALAAVGIYGVISYGVRDRTREIGIRVALGGTQADILRLIMIASLKPVIVGVAIGTCVAIAASRLINALLYQVTATDAPTYVLVILALIFTGILATCVPAWRAIKADPLIALRHE